MILSKTKQLDPLATLIIPIKDNIESLTALCSDSTLSKLLRQQWEKDPTQSFSPLYIDDRWVIPINYHKADDYQKIRKTAQKLSHGWLNMWGDRVTIDLSEHDLTEGDAILNGLITGSYKIGKYKSSSSTKHYLKSISVKSESISDDELNRIFEMSLTQCEIMDLVNGPANKSNIKFIIDWASQSGKNNNYSVKIIESSELEELGLNALISVGRASPTPSKLLILEYNNKSNDQKTIGLVGKGITFDTGGISIKGATNMHYMKSDMGGAAAVLGAVEIAAKTNLAVHIVGIIPLAENVIAGNALLPGDIIDSYSGKTIEVIDTDAEGRLVLADGLFYTQKHYSPDILIDLATLTGSSVRTFGYQCGALFSNNDSLSNSIQSIGQQFGERLWPLPLWKEYDEDLHSDVADVRNMGTMPLAGCILAAKFLQNFTNNHPSWMHLDIAGVAFGNQIMSKQKAGTAFGVKLLYEFIRILE